MIETAARLVQAQADGLTQRQMAALVGRSKAWVNRVLQWEADGCADTPFGPEAKAKRRRKAARRSGVFPEQTSRPDVLPIAWSEANTILHEHYLGRMSYATPHCYATPARDAVAVYAAPTAAHFKRIAGLNPVELSRLWVADGAPFPTSQFLARTMWWLKKRTDFDCVLSYADARGLPIIG
jgi:hypothetical protein